MLRKTSAAHGLAQASTAPPSAIESAIEGDWLVPNRESRTALDQKSQLRGE